ncbi:MAG: Inositol-1-phosphate synthase, partial [uncultured Gemmatimonadaceae bacterium]
AGFQSERAPVRQTRHGPPRHPHAGDGRRRDDVLRGRRERAARAQRADRLAHADGDHPPRQAHREPLAAHQGLRPPRGSQRPRLRRLGPDPRRRLHGGQEGGRARRQGHRADRRLPPVDRADARGVRQQVRHPHQRHQRQDGEEQARPGRAAAAGHPRLQAEAQARARGARVVRLHRDLHQGRPPAPDARGVRARDGGERRRHRAVDALRLRGDHGRVRLLQRRAEPLARLPRARAARQRPRRGDLGQGLQDRPDLDEDGDRARAQGAHARPRRLVLHQHPRQPRRRGARRPRLVQDQGGVEALGAAHHPAARDVPGALQGLR